MPLSVVERLKICDAIWFDLILLWFWFWLSMMTLILILIVYDDFVQPERGGKTEGAPWLGSTQLCQVFCLQLHHHVVEPAHGEWWWWWKDWCQDWWQGWGANLSFLPQPMKRQTCSRPCSFLSTATCKHHHHHHHHQYRHHHHHQYHHHRHHHHHQ